ncbi:IS66 family insertion sequence element accessory protein TnpB [Sinorhizobium fredii]|uniref:IS66 family insertion sequence element accessory protein TnpB n=1 Tax=Rhizobium fredii TaxID=380 RepID=UPI0013770852|nr:IS66 family insertion sequence element accessory protein TnpB [Sinorhizobium fredii]
MIALQLWCARCEGRHDRCGPTLADPDRDAAGGLPLWPSALALMVQTELKLDPHSGVTVIFRSKRGDRLKILVWDGTGMVLIYKVLEQGNFAWPKVQDGTMRLSRAQFEALFEGLDWRRVMAQRVTPPTAAG